MDTKNIIIVSGMSGAGKSTAMGILEDMGYHCIDQFPVELLKDLGKLIREGKDPRYQNVALATNALDFETFAEYFREKEIDVNILFLDASDEKLLARYKFTRRTHPFIVFDKASSLEDAIEGERDMFNTRLVYKNMLRIDTTKLTQKTLKDTLAAHLNFEKSKGFSISFISFGYKHAVPMDADILLDVRFLPNPYYIAELREKTGDDKEVYDYVLSFPQTDEFLKRTIPYLDYLFEQYQLEGKTHLTVGIGCTGGQHRSVTLTNYLYTHYQNQYNCHKGHRDKKGG